MGEIKNVLWVKHARGTYISKTVTCNNVFDNYAVKIMLTYGINQLVCSYVMFARRVLNEALNATAYLDSATIQIIHFHLDVLDQMAWPI